VCLVEINAANFEVLSMSVVYVNNFDHLLHSSGEVVGSIATLDPPVFVPGHPITFLGPMHAGGSVPPPAATIEASTTDFGPAPFGFRLSEGTSVTLFNPAAYQSTTFHVVAPNAILLSRGTLFQAELVFDRPTGVLDPGVSGKVWAVQLFFKTGNATDRSNGNAMDPTNDIKIGAVCQFHDGGYIKFHGTDNTWGGPLTAVYSDYSGNPLTEFRLTATLAVGSGGAIAATGAFQFDDNLQWGHCPVPNDLTTGLPLTANKLTAVGFMLTTLGNFESFGARIRSFTLSVT
jgi:hypothetical protein